ncbi:unnamed protein product [Arabidopsis halleri]
MQWWLRLGGREVDLVEARLRTPVVSPQCLHVAQPPNRFPLLRRKSMEDSGFCF